MNTGEKKYPAAAKAAAMITAIMHRYQISQYRMAKLLGTTQTTIARWQERGPSNPTMVLLALKELDRQLKRDGDKQ